MGDHRVSTTCRQTQEGSAVRGAPMSALDHYAVNRLMQELFSEPENLASFTADRAALYDKYGLSADQRTALDGGGQEALTSAGLHRSAEHTSELQSLMRISYAVSCLTQQQNTYI